MSFLQKLFGAPSVEDLAARGSIKGLTKALCDLKDARVPKRASEELVKIGKPAVDRLVAALKVRNAQARWLAAEALGEIRDPRAVEPLIATLTDPNKGVSWRAATALGNIRDSRAVEPLIAALTDPDWSVRQEAATALGKIRDPRAVEPLIAVLDDRNRGVRFSAAQALGWIGDARAVVILTTTLTDSDDSVRCGAAKALGEIRDPRAVEPLIAALDDIQATVRRAAAQALRQTGDPRASELIELSKRGADTLSIKSLRSPAFEWSSSGFAGRNEKWVDQIRQESESAISWFNAQNFVPIPISAGEKVAAEWCFSMAKMAQDSGNIQEAWAGYPDFRSFFCKQLIFMGINFASIKGRPT